MRCAAWACAMNTASARLPDAETGCRVILQGGGIRFARGQMLLACAFHDRIGVEAELPRPLILGARGGVSTLR